MPKRSKISPTSLRGDLQGGIVASIMVVSRAIPLGVLVFAPFGPATMALGTFAAIVSVIFSNIGAALVRGNAIVINAPYSPTTLMLASAATLIMSRVGAETVDATGVALPLTLLFFIVFASGACQVLLGLFKVGFIAKYVSYPVIAGLVNGTAILIVLGQTRAILGVGQEVALYKLLWSPGLISLPTLLIGAATLLLLWKSTALIRWLPPELGGLLGGTLLFYIFRLLNLQAIGGTIGTIASGFPSPKFLPGFIELALQPHTLTVIRELLPIILSITLINSLHTLVLDMMVGNLTEGRPDSNRELIGQGLGNMLSSVFGGVSASGSTPATISGYHNGGHTVSVKVFCGLFSLLILLAFAPALALLPQVVIAASLLKSGFDLFDAWSVTLLKRVVTRQIQAFPYVDALIVLSVTIVSVAIGIFEAVLLGVLLSVVHFIARMSKNLIAREYNATRMRSNVIRPEAEITFLEAEGGKIRLLELQGALFFGTADQLANRIETIMLTADNHVRYIIVDFRKVREIDATGANQLQQIRNRCHKQGVSLILSSVTDDDAWQHYNSLGIAVSARPEGIYPDIDVALAYAEDCLLDEAFGAERHQQEKQLQEIPLLQVLEPEEFALLERLMRRVTYNDGELIYRQGDSSNDLYFILRGRARIEVTPPGSNTSRVLAILCRGMLFGEMALLDGKTRSADVRAVGDFVGVSLSKEAMEMLISTYPDTAIRLYKEFALIFSFRMRISNRINTELRK